MEALFPILFAIGFPFLWVAVARLLAQRGWQRLAQAYATERPAAGQRVRVSSVRINGVSYSNVVQIRVAPEGLYLWVMVLFKPGHPPLLIPWSAIGEGEQKRWRAVLLVSLPDAPDPVRIEFSKRAMEKLAAAMATATLPSTSG